MTGSESALLLLGASMADRSNWWYKGRGRAVGMKKPCGELSNFRGCELAISDEGKAAAVGPSGQRAPVKMCASAASALNGSRNNGCDNASRQCLSSWSLFQAVCGGSVFGTTDAGREAVRSAASARGPWATRWTRVHTAAAGNYTMSGIHFCLQDAAQVAAAAGGGGWRQLVAAALQQVCK